MDNHLLHIDPGLVREAHRRAAFCYRLYLENGVLHYESREAFVFGREEEKEKKCLPYDSMQAFSVACKEAMQRTHPGGTPAPMPSAEGDSDESTSLDALCACLELPVENWDIVYPLA